MGEFASSITALFGGKSGAQKRAEASAAQDRVTAGIERTRASEEARRARADTAGGMAAGGRAPRGRRLLVSEESAGLASTIGEAI